MIPFLPSFRTGKTKLCCFKGTHMGVTTLKIKARTVTKSECVSSPVQFLPWSDFLPHSPGDI